MSVKLHWVRNKYKGRGILLEQDKIAEFQMAGKCVICGKTKERKRYVSGSLEHSSAFQARKTCGRYIGEDGYFHAGSCLRIIPQGKRFVKGQDGWLKGKTFDEVFGEEVSTERKEKLSREMKKKLATGKIDVTKPKIECVCKVCGKVTLESPWRAGSKKVCGLSCAGTLSVGSTGKHWTLRNRREFLEIQQARRKGEYKKCTVCQKEFYLHPSTAKIAAGKYCSKKCEAAPHRTVKPCQKCMQLFTVRKSESWKIKNCKPCRVLR